MLARRKLVAGNWKMHGSLAQNAALLAGFLPHVADLDCEIGLCVPYPYLAQVQQLLGNTAVRLGAQNLSEHAQGAFTGEISGAMLADFSCRYVLVGHSERRTLFGESDAQVAAKFGAALSAGLTPILCVGETLDERERGETESVIGRQLQAVLERFLPATWGDAVIAYEPVWAIGTGRSASPEQAQAVHAFIRAFVSGRDALAGQAVRVLYGGSVKPGNARELFAQADIDGGLIGGASLVAEDFLTICQAAV